MGRDLGRCDALAEREATTTIQLRAKRICACYLRNPPERRGSDFAKLPDAKDRGSRRVLSRITCWRRAECRLTGHLSGASRPIRDIGAREVLAAKPAIRSARSNDRSGSTARRSSAGRPIPKRRICAPHNSDLSATRVRLNRGLNHPLVTIEGPDKC
jgi:hypothetical protein